MRGKGKFSAHGGRAETPPTSGRPRERSLPGGHLVLWASLRLSFGSKKILL